MSQNSHGLNIHLKCTARDAEGNEIGTSEKDYDTALDNLANYLIVSMLGGLAATYTALENAAGAPTAILLPTSALWIVAGTDVSGGPFASTDYKLVASMQADVWGKITAPVFAASAPAAGGSFTITGTFTNSDAIAHVYGEVGILVTDTTPTLFLLTHDATNTTFGYSVPSLGTLDVVYTVNYT